MALPEAAAQGYRRYSAAGPAEPFAAERQNFAVVQEIPFDALIRDPPDAIEDRAEFKDLVQAMRDLTATVLGRALKNKLWQDAENQISLISNYFDSPDDAVVNRRRLVFAARAR